MGLEGVIGRVGLGGCGREGVVGGVRLGGGVVGQGLVGDVCFGEWECAWHGSGDGFYDTNHCDTNCNFHNTISTPDYND